jgi:hypothetical protein
MDRWIGWREHVRGGRIRKVHPVPASGEEEGSGTMAWACVEGDWSWMLVDVSSEFSLYAYGKERKGSFPFLGI